MARILVVEAREAHRRAFAALLRAAGHDVVTTSDLALALAALQAGQHPLIALLGSVCSSGRLVDPGDLLVLATGDRDTDRDLDGAHSTPSSLRASQRPQPYSAPQPRESTTPTSQTGPAWTARQWRPTRDDYLPLTAEPADLQSVTVRPLVNRHVAGMLSPTCSIGELFAAIEDATERLPQKHRHAVSPRLSLPPRAASEPLAGTIVLEDAAIGLAPL